MSELNTDTDGKLAEEPFNANDNNKIKNVQVSHRSKYQWTGKSFTPLFRCRRSDCTSLLEPVLIKEKYTLVSVDILLVTGFGILRMDLRIETMTGILLKMGITSMPRYRMYWAAGTRLDFVPEQ
ncbi:hypothetical protein T4B_9845 [Trichinella pseudospiralis]|uniref:PiggyBac transposable element-derived protein domain-containing protein n=1 Tax=Trichinella pseudospiralis TaxID=6337 RepID=A0A0V1EP33_TRIPS|nr:hypothetical protein T4A_8908 [Trichinella pseudospiralis]KRZ23364.1 hypothetical protein T4B_9845 [Trichinella pseudospiralis]KRZ38520.1 hypothetical protein T4C_1568 [Trichinella pseudospiralis]